MLYMYIYRNRQTDGLTMTQRQIDGQKDNDRKKQTGKRLKSKIYPTFFKSITQKNFFPGFCLNINFSIKITQGLFDSII